MPSKQETHPPTRGTTGGPSTDGDLMGNYPMSAPNGQIWTTGVAITTDPTSAQNGGSRM